MKTFIVVLAAMAAGAAALSEEPVAAFPATQSTTAVAGGCPNDCSGNGYCRDDAKCLCFAGYVGYDCSLRECPTNRAWGVDNAILSKAVECSYRGQCNRNTGECECFDGFEGAACERTACPNSCSGHGRCRAINELALASSYSEWDGDRIQACDCDGGYFGSDCSLRKCPVGDDPQSTCGEQDPQVQVMSITFPTSATAVVGTGTAPTTATTDVEGDLVLTFKDNLGNVWNTRRIADIFTLAASSATEAATTIKNAIKELPNFAASDVTVYVNKDGSTTPSAFVKGTDSVLKIRVEFSGATVAGTQPTMQCPGPFLGCPFRGCQPKWVGPRLVTKPTGSAFNLYGTDSVSDWLPQPEGHTTRTAARLLSVEVDWDVPTATSSNGVAATFSVLANDNDGAGGTSVSRGSSSIRYQRHTDHATTPFEAGFGMRLKLDTAVAITDVTDAYHVIIPGCQVDILEEADAGKEDMECAGRGLCDRSSGLCQCFEGYSGYACNEVHISI